MNPWSKGTIVCSVLAVAGCASDKPEQGIIAKEWSVNTRQLGIHPIYPPRERFYPGDIYVMAYFEGSRADAMLPLDYSLMSQRFDHIDLGALITAEQAIKPLPELASYKDGEGKEIVPWPVVSYPAGGSGRANGIVAFPGFTFASASSVKLGANLATGGWGGSIGGGQESHYTVSYLVPAAEYVSVPMRPAMQSFRAWRAALADDVCAWSDLLTLSRAVVPAGHEDPALASPTCESGKKVAPTPKGGKKTPAKRPDLNPVVVFPNEVFYARAIDVTVSADEAMSAKMAAVTASMIEASETKTALEQKMAVLNGTVPPTPVAQAEQASKAATLKAQIDALQARITQSAQAVIPSVPGVTGSVTRSSAYGVTLRQTFRYPVAIGYRGMHFYVSELMSGSPAEAKSGTPTPALHKGQASEQ